LSNTDKGAVGLIPALELASLTAPNHNLLTHFPQNSSQNNQTPFQPHTHTVNIATIKATLEVLIEEEQSQLISSIEDFPREN